ncbi:MAG: glutamine synthetase family protein [Pseudomonadota bacterium]
MDIDTTSLRAACADLNGQMRGKRLPADEAAKLEFSGMRMPLSVMNVDLWGADIEGSPLVFESGDADGQLRVTDRGPVAMPWLEQASTLVPMWMFYDDGRPFEVDPRHALGQVLAGYARRGWKVIAATELEFTLIEPSGDTPHPAGWTISGDIPYSAACSIDALDRHAAFFDDLYAGAEAMDIAIKAAVSETGVGQFEINLSHGPAMRVADDTWLFKSLVRGMAHRHGLSATFMAKPFEGDAGNGLHLHMSVEDRAGRNLFDNGLMSGSPLLRQAVAGCLSTMPGATLIFAPHGNSYDRITPGAHAPTGAAWGYENRTTAIRIPGGDPAARRLEHRVAGGDTNPYLVIAAILGGALMGIEDNLSPPEPVIGNAYSQRVLQFPTDWDGAIERFSISPRMKRIFPETLIENFTLTKRQEQRRTAPLKDEALRRTMLELL